MKLGVKLEEMEAFFCLYKGAMEETASKLANPAANSARDQVKLDVDTSFEQKRREPVLADCIIPKPLGRNT